MTGRDRRPGEPEIVHDGGPLFIGHKLAQFGQATGMTNVRSHPYHPQSKGNSERVHRTFRTRASLHAGARLHEACTVIETYRVYHGERRHHSALHYLCPRDNYRGDPVPRLAERHAKLHIATEARRAYWEQHRSAVRSTS